MSNVLTRELLPDEVVQWSGRPARGLRFALTDLPVTAIGLGLIIVAVVFELSASGQNDWLAKLWGAPCAFLGMHLAFGRYLFEARRRASTLYAVTNRRVLIIEYLFGRTTTSLLRSQLAEVQVIDHRDGRATIHFGRPTDHRSHAPLPKFAFIDDAQTPLALLTSVPLHTYR